VDGSTAYGGVRIDVTDLRRTLGERQRVLAFLDQVIDHGPGGLYAYDSRGFTYVSVPEWSGYRPEQYYSDPAFRERTIAPEDRDRVMRGIREAEHAGLPYKFEYGFVNAAGERLWVDMSTVSPAESRDLAAEARRRGVRVLDAPVSGSLGAAVKGMLVILVGDPAHGPKRRGQRHQAGGERVPSRDHGRGLRGAQARIREGVRREELLEALTRTEILPAWVLGKLESLGAGEMRTAFSLALADKDLRLIEETASAASLELPLAKAVAGVYARALEAGLGDRDFSAVDTAG